MHGAGRRAGRALAMPGCCTLVCTHPHCAYFGGFTLNCTELGGGHVHTSAQSCEAGRMMLAMPVMKGLLPVSIASETSAPSTAAAAAAAASACCQSHYQPLPITADLQMDLELDRLQVDLTHLPCLTHLFTQLAHGPDSPAGGP
eukprot:1161796-Pelagomonas_calceolata.AAC.6